MLRVASIVRVNVFYSTLLQEAEDRGYLALSVLVPSLAFFPVSSRAQARKPHFGIPTIWRLIGLNNPSVFPTSASVAKKLFAAPLNFSTSLLHYLLGLWAWMSLRKRACSASPAL